MKKLIIIVVLIMFLLTTACVQEGVQEMIIPRDKHEYAVSLAFAARIIADGERVIVTRDWEWFREIDHRILPYGETFDPSYTEMVFVLNEAEAEARAFPDSTIVAWPQEGIAQGVINGLYWTALFKDIDIEAETGLVYPLTVENLVYDWDAINRLLSLFENSDLHSVRRTAERDGADAFLNNLEILRLAGGREALNRVRVRSSELGIEQDIGLDILRAAGSIDVFFAIADRIQEDGLSVEAALEMLREQVQ